MTREGPLQYGSTRGTREYPTLSKYLPRVESLSSPEVFRDRLRGYHVITPDAAALRAERIANLPRANDALYERAPAELHVHLTGLQEPAACEEIATSTAETALAPRVHLPRASPNGLLDRILCDAQPRHLRELVNDEGWSQLFSERQNERPYLTSELFPQQRSSDPVFFRETIRKRLVRTTFAENERDYRDKAFQATALFGAFLKLTELGTAPLAFDRELMADCVYENEFVKLTKKTQAVLANNVDRSRPDWKLNFVDHFVKSQLKGKLEALNVPGKAGQTIATCSDLVVLLFGPLVRYLRAKIMHRWPDNLFCNCGKSLAEQSAWARKHWRDVPSTTSDYTSFDASQRGDSLGFEYMLMRHFGLHEAWLLAFELHRDDFTDVTETYLDWKLHTVSSVVGEKRTGRDSGEPGTYDFNTYFSMAIYQLMYAPARGTVACFGGDDLAANADLLVTPAWLRLNSRFDIVAKVLRTKRPEFCGYYMTSRGCFKNPDILLLKPRPATAI